MRFEEAGCTGGVFADYGHDGTGSGVLISEIGAAQRSNLTTYHTMKTRSRSMTPEQARAGVIAFRDANTFCLLENVPNPVGSEIDQFVQSINLNSSTICWKKSNVSRFQRLAPSTVLGKPLYMFVDVQPTLARLQTQLNEQATLGYRLIEASLQTSTPSTTASNLLVGDDRQKRNLLVKSQVAGAAAYQYRVLDGTADSVSARFALWKTQLRDQASQGYLYHSLQRVDLVNPQPDITNHIFVKKVGDTAVYSITEQTVSQNTITATTWANVPNQMGANGCRLFFSENIFSNQHAYVCAKSNQFTGTYSYRWVELPTATTANNATAIQAILDSQKAAGYLYRFEAFLGDERTRGMVFERDSTQPNIGQGLQYKVFDDGATERSHVSVIDERISNQALLGWHLWDGRLTIREGGLLSDAVIRTIYANRPLP